MDWDVTVRTADDRLAELVRAESTGGRLKYLFFWKEKATGAGSLGPECLSQFYASPLTVGAVTYRSAEHWMMAEKARLFGDDEALRHLGRDVVHDLGRYVGRVGQEGPQETHGAQLQREADAVAVAPALVDQAPVDVIKEEEPLQLCPRRWSYEAAVDRPVSSREFDDHDPPT
jgi:hypothetical protein